MQRTLGFLTASACVLALSACGGGSGNSGIGQQAKVSVDELATGSYSVALGDANTPTVGRYYAGADGSRLLVLTDGDDRINQLYRRAAGEAWVAVPASSQDVKVALLRSSAVPANTLAVASLAGNYAARVAAGVTANFTVLASGDIVAGASACKLSGKLTASALPNTLQLSLSATGCGSLPASSTGTVAVDAEDAPARFRITADNASQLVDLWAYAE